LNQRSAIFVVCSLLALVTLACFWPVTAHKFIDLDDPLYIYDNPHVKAGMTWSGIIWAFQSGYASNWHPLTWISHMLDYQLYGPNPAGHHLTSLLLHLTNTLLLFLLLLRMTGSRWRSTFVAALFAWHPLHVESVAWAAERKDVLCTFFFLLALLAYVRYAELQRLKLDSKVQSQAPADGIQHPAAHLQSATFYLLSLLLFALGLMSKPMVVTLPFVLLLLDYWPLRRLSFPLLHRSSTSLVQSPITPLLRLVCEKLPFFALALAVSVVTYLVQRAGGAVSSLDLIPFHTRIANALVAYVRYLSLTLWPADLAVLYPYPRHLPAGSIVAAALLLAGLCLCFLWRMKRHPFLIVGWLWYLGTLVPTIGLVQVGLQSMADRYAYIPSIGLFMLVVWGSDAVLDCWPHRRKLLAVVGGLALVGCLACTSHQLGYWRDCESLYRHAIAVTTDNYIAYDRLGSALEELGKSDEALASFSESVRLKPGYPAGQYDLGTSLMKRERLEEAVRHLTAALKNDPTYAHAYINLGKVLLEQGKLDEAVVHLSEAVRLSSDDPEAQYNLGTVLVMQAKPDEAIACFSEALRLKPDYAEAHGNLGVLLMRQGKLGEGATHFAAALRLNPSNPEAHYNLGLALLELNHPREAAEQLAEALRLNPDAPGPHYHLALALVRQDKPKEALPHAQKAHDLALAAGQPALAATADELLKQLR
jgi:protein O-mannosyl-transferase